MNDKHFVYEEHPLQNSTLYKRSRQSNSLKLPLRVIRLCFLGVLLPCALLGVPLYMRYRVYGLQLYPLAMSDMRMLDSRVSTTWCQRQLVKVNTTFNAFLLSNTPKISVTRQPLSMIRELDLEDDTKEYWGFYLLKGTSVKVSTCVRWPGASLIVIRGHKHLHECAYIGDDSSEELDEMMEAIREGTYVDVDENIIRVANDTDTKQPTNDPQLMKRHRPEVEFHSSIHRNTTGNHTLVGQHEDDATSEDTDSKDLKHILDALREKSNSIRNKLKAGGHVHRNSTIAKEETENMQIEAPREVTDSQEVLSDILKKLRGLGDKGTKILGKVNEHYRNQEGESAIDTMGRHYSKPSVHFDESIDRARRRKRDLILSTALGLNDNDEKNDLAIEEGLSPDGIADHRGFINETTLNDMSNSEFWSSFSSSEEALLNCAGLILNLPLMPHHKCLRGHTEEESYQDNTITYRVPSNGYYFFVFSSENEVVKNYVRVHFEIEKTVYNVSDPVAFCVNKSDSCSVDLDFFSSEKLVMELPVNRNDTMWNEEFIVVSECEPRTALYAAFVMLVPIMVGMFAFS